MIVEQLYTGCLAEAAYYIESNGEAAIIDPLRETDPYIKKLKGTGAKLKYIFETHFHADFVSGHVDLAKKTGASIIYGPNAETNYKSYSAKDNELFELGKVKIKVLHTPGHTMESSTFLLIDENGKEHSIFTGDTLFIGDVGRPDLAVKTNLTREDLAGHLYDSLRNKLMVLPDNIVVYPAHGAGSACGKSMSKETFDTLGHQKEVNYALQKMSKEAFIKKVTEGLLPPPQYFPLNAQMNKMGYSNIDVILNQGLTKLSPNEFEDIANQTGALVLDTREAQVFRKKFIPGSINMGLGGQFAPWVGALITDIKQPILIVADIGKEEEVVTRLARVGYDNTLGYLDGGIDAWIRAGKNIDSILSITALEFESIFLNDKVNVVDVRKKSEYDAEHIKEATNLPLDFINEWTGSLNKSKTYYIHCAGGYRSMIAASILKARGFENLVDIAGGFKSIAETQIPKTDYVCPINGPTKKGWFSKVKSMLNF
jgi:glyoxylase-like metal-dependent hydrolase (beta-lactamase superfamily II)/rhodanese-related sulfurtransferase